MKNLKLLDKYRVYHPMLDTIPCDPAKNGCFAVQTTAGRKFSVIASVDMYDNEKLVDHISISHRNEKIMPTWEEMCQIKDMFFDAEEECVQFFPKKSEYVNIRKNCFHLWHPVNCDVFISPNDAQAEETAPVVHGRWGPSEKFPGHRQCSVCKGFLIDEKWLENEKWKFCPECGAKMDLEM